MNNYFKKKDNQSMFEESSSFKDFFQMPFFKQENMLKTDIIENDNSYTLVIDVPGCKKENVKISSADGYLTIEVNTNSNKEFDHQNYLRKERLHGTYSRSYYIGKNIHTNEIEASFANGLLAVNFPKEKEDNSTTYIPIK